MRSLSPPLTYFTLGGKESETNLTLTAPPFSVHPTQLFLGLLLGLIFLRMPRTQQRVQDRFSVMFMTNLMLGE